ncbi:MAG: hypothetical protein FK730_13520 [Asgard group archaeon]|nr:hypothetical protein [Asgard group archaeon]
MSLDSNPTDITMGDNFADFLTKVDKIPLEKKVELADEFNCSQSFGGVIYLLQTDLLIDGSLVLDDLNLELNRLKKVDKELPEIETYLYKFAIEEGKWIAFLRGSLGNSIANDIKNIQILFKKLGKLKGSDLITLATQLMMERQFIAVNKIIPVMEKWCSEHTNSTCLDITIRLLAGIIGEKASEKITDQMDNARKELVKQIEVLGDILSNAEESNWIIRALIEAEILYEDLSQPLDEMTTKGLSDIVIWLLAQSYEKKIGDYTSKEEIGRLIMRFQLESALGLSTASPQVKLEYNLLSLTYKDDLAKKNLAEKILKDAWKESRISDQPINVGREILAMLMDYSNLSSEFLSKVPRHFEFVTTHFQRDKARLNRALNRIKIKGKKPTELEMQEAVILDYLIHFVSNYIVNKFKADPEDLDIVEDDSGLDISIAEKDIIDMIDASLRRGIRKQNISDAKRIIDSQIQSLYQRLLNVVENEITVGETILYGIFNSHKVKISRDSARELILNHFKRMKVSPDKSGKKRIDSAVQMAVSIEIEEKILKRDIR